MSTAVSQAVTRRSASNLALAFVLLPREQREAMAALYAFCREVDDVADEDTVAPEVRRARLADWRADIQRACTAGRPEFAIDRELQPFIQRYRLPLSLFEELIRGVEMDLDHPRYATHAELDTYCYRVASVVGLLSIEIFGYRNPACRDYAVSLGKALQLTNILRDVAGDADRGRIYLPQAELERHAVPESDLLEHRYSERYRALATGVAARARGFYREARRTLPAEDRPAMIAAELMGAVYWDLLNRLERQRFDVFGRRLGLSKARKAYLILRTWVRLRRASPAPNYGCE